MKNRNLSIILTVFFLIAGLAYYQADIRKAVAEQFFNRANYYFGAETYNLNKAEKYFKIASKIEYQFPEVHHQLARIAFLKGDFEQALKEINIQIGIDPNLTTSYYVRGLINGYTKNFNQAEIDFKKFLSQDANNWAAYNDLSWIYFQKGDYLKTAETARKGLVYNTDNPWLLTSLGTALFNLNKRDEARLTLEKALTIFEHLTATQWQEAYPGNNPAIAEEGLRIIKEKINFNLGLISNTTLTTFLDEKNNQETTSFISGKFSFVSLSPKGLQGGYIIPACGGSDGDDGGGGNGGGDDDEPPSGCGDCGSCNDSRYRWCNGECVDYTCECRPDLCDGGGGGPPRCDDSCYSCGTYSECGRFCGYCPPSVSLSGPSVVEVPNAL
ncbi:MAG: tetratricopeptide repeat protein, partial [Patescibacteria group bacterium]